MKLRRVASYIYHNTWCKALYHTKLYLYWRTIPQKVKAIRKKDTIKVLFVTSELASWKTELLYQKMLAHPRFNPVLGVSTSYAPNNVKKPLTDYLRAKGYHFIDLDSEKGCIDKINPDIIFYFKPYSNCYSPGQFFSDNLKYVFCGLDYCFEATTHAVHIYREYFDYCWQFFVENKEIANRRKEVLGYRARNTRITGTPIQDVLRFPKEFFDDPWKDKTGKKRIIYAPHHSIKGTNGCGIEFATFLSYGELMLELAKRYSDYITIAFKPHPNLYMKLLDIWGQDKTDAYYNSWVQLSNTQLETGDYYGLFKYSDAIIHDSASFIIEYLYMDNPSMYLIADTNNLDDMFQFVRDGFNCYEIGLASEDIENFINDVIEGRDNNREKRRDYISSQLQVHNGTTACDNIINSILSD